MGQIQSAISGAISSGIQASVASSLKKEEERIKTAEAEELKKDKSFVNPVRATFTEAAGLNPKILSAKYLDKAMQMEKYTETLMKFQRDMTRAYRDQFVKGSDEWNRIEAEGQARKQTNLTTFRENLLKMGKRGRPKGGK